MAQVLLLNRLLFPVLCLVVYTSELEGKWVSSEKDMKLETEARIVNNPHHKTIQNLSTLNNSLSQGVGSKRSPILERFARNFSSLDIQPTVNSGIINHWAVIVTSSTQGEYYGAQASLNVYGLPQVGATQSSGATIVLVNGLDSKPDNFNAIQAGWHVQPSRYGDHDTHFFLSWTVDANYNTGCYNLDCKGFVLDKSSNYTPGGKITPLSKYNGVQTYVTLKISKDQQSGDWWLHHGPKGDKPIGYWPKSLFTSLADNAFAVQWGGIVGFTQYEKSPPMGSGHGPNEGEGKAASLKDVRLVSKDGGLYAEMFYEHSDREDCYQIGGSVTTLYGGPGGCD